MLMGMFLMLGYVKGTQFIPQTLHQLQELNVHQGPDDDRTVVLTCYDGENIFADKTGRHIIAYGDVRSSTPTVTDSPLVLQHLVQD